MKKLTNKNLDIYLYIKEFIDEKGYCPSYREIQQNSNYNSISSVKQAIDKLEDIGMIKTNRDENGNIIGRTIKIINNEKTKEIIENLRNEFR